MQVVEITGASGFLGRHLVVECLQQERFQLRLLTRHPEKLGTLPGQGAVPCVGDLLRPETYVDFLQPGSTLIHLAYIPGNRAANLAATQDLIDAAKLAKVARVVHCSTAVVVGFGTPGIVSEHTIPRPESDYQQTKYAIEEMLRRQLLPPVELAILRPTEIIGLGGKGLPPILHRLRDGSPLKNAVYRFLLRSRRFNYISAANVVAALILLATTSVEQRGDVYFVSDDDDPDNGWLAIENIVQQALGRAPVRYPAGGLPAGMLPFLFKLLPGHSRPDRIYCHEKISTLGYHSIKSLRSTIVELVQTIE